MRRILLKQSALCGIAITIMAFGMSACQQQTQLQGQASNLSEAIDQLAKAEMKDTGLPSLQIAVGYKGNVIFENAYGLADTEGKIPATIITQYRTASISKWFTGTTVMKLVEMGKLDLDASIQNYCPQFPEKQAPITTRQLLSHTAGVRHYLNPKSMKKAAKTKQEKAEVAAWIKRDELSYNQRFTDMIAPLENFKNDPLIFDPGMGYSYSSHGFRVLGCVIRGASEKPYREIVESLVFAPVGMVHTTDDDASVMYTNRATGYELVRRRKLKLADPRDVSENLPAGGHLSTATDLVKFAQAFDRGEIVSEKSIKLMSSLPVAKTGVELNVGYGHGVDFIGAFPGSLGHGGRQEGATTLLVLLPEEDISIAVMTNARGWNNSNGFVQKILDIKKQYP